VDASAWTRSHGFERWRSLRRALALSYGWPIKPFNKQHPIRGYFGDPRTVYENGVLAGGFDGPGFFSFHQGVDISAPNGTPIYPVVSGIAHYLGRQRGTSTPAVLPGHDRIFQYFHIVPIVVKGMPSSQIALVIGYVQAPFGHVHLTEITVRAPSIRCRRAPRSVRRPHATDDSLTRWIRNQTGLLQTPLGRGGRVEIAVDAFDTPPMRVPGQLWGTAGRARARALEHQKLTAHRSSLAHRRGLPLDAAGEWALLRRLLRKAPTRMRRDSALSSTAQCPDGISSCSPGTSTRTRSRTPSTRSGSTRPTTVEQGVSSTSGSPS